MSFSEYPKMMVHPNAQPAVVGFNHGEGRPATFQPVFVQNADQEEEYAAKGYAIQGSPDAQAFDRVSAGGTPPGYKYQEYPKFVRVEGEDVLVHSQEHEHEVLGYNEVEESLEEAPKRRGRPPKSDRMRIDE